MKQLLEEAKKDIPTLKNRILQIVNVERGKMHNPVTNSGIDPSSHFTSLWSEFIFMHFSGGVMLGYVKSVGSGLRSSWPNEGDAVIPLASLSCIPLHIESIGEIVGDRVEVKVCQNTISSSLGIAYTSVGHGCYQRSHCCGSSTERFRPRTRSRRVRRLSCSAADTPKNG